MHEIVLNLHTHTRYSDGGGSHRDIAEAAMDAGLDAVIVTDHNLFLDGIEGYYKARDRRLLVLIGEEVHDRSRVPQKSHLLVLGAHRELAFLADNTDALLRAVQESGGLSFVAHPDDLAAPAFNEPNISWEDWSGHTFAGLELWNGFSELKTLIPTKIHGIFYAFFPTYVAHRPLAQTLRRWDELMVRQPMVAIGGSDAHASRMHLGPLHRIVLPYAYHFRTINTHVLLPEPLSGDAARDAQSIYSAIGAGHCFVGNDLPAPSRGFRFIAHGPAGGAIMGDQLTGRGSITLEMHLPAFAEIRLLRDGKVVRSLEKSPALTLLVDEPGAYRVEAYRRHLGKRRGWIFSNPIYIR